MHFQRLVEGKLEHKEIQNKNFIYKDFKKSNITSLSNDNIDQIVDNILSEKNILSYHKKIKNHNQNNKEIKSNKNIKYNHKNRKKSRKKIIAVLLTFVLVFAYMLSLLPQTYGFSEIDINISLNQTIVNNGETMYINVTIPLYYNITSVKADTVGFEIIDLYISDYSSNNQIWTGTWLVDNLENGDYITSIEALDNESVKYSAKIGWQVINEEYNTDPSNDTNQFPNGGEQGVAFENQSDANNSTLDIENNSNETINEDYDDFNYSSESENDLTESYDQSISNNKEKESLIIIDESVFIENDDNKIQPFLNNIDENSFGFLDDKVVNWDYFWNYFKQYSHWVLEYYDIGTNNWISCNEYLDVLCIRSDDNTREKTTLNFNAPLSAKYRLTFTIDASLSDYFDKSTKNRYILEYPVGENDKYSVFFDWSDITSLDFIDWKKGFTKKDNKDVFWFQITSKDIIQKDSFISIDPTFGRSDTPSSSVILEDNIRGLYASPSSNGSADSITVYLDSTGATKSMKCALYEYIDYSSEYAGNLIAVTEEKSISASDDGWNTFNFQNPLPILTEGTNYYIVAWADSGTGNLEIGCDNSGGTDGIVKSQNYVENFPDPLSTESSTVNQYYIYCTYTNHPPEQSSHYIWDGFVNHTLNCSGVFQPPVSFNLNISDSDQDKMNITLLTNASGVWEIVNQTSGSGLFDGSYIFTNTSWVDTENITYWISFNLTDGINWCNETYHFTTRSGAPAGNPYLEVDTPENSMGINKIKEMNCDYFWDFFDYYNSWTLEESTQGNIWLENTTSNLTVYTNRTSDNSSEKITLNLSSNKDAYYRIKFSILKPVLSYIDNNESYRYELTYAANDTELYTVFFNWSDYINSPEADNTSCDYGIKRIRGDDYFWFQIQTNNTINNGEFLEIDPTFGRNGTPEYQSDLENNIRGIYATCAHPAEADSISVYLSQFTGGNKNMKCAIYEYSDYSSNYAGNLIAETEEKTLSGTVDEGWQTFNFAEPKPSLTEGTNYYLVTWGSSASGWLQIGNTSGGSDGIYESQSYGAWEDPLTGESSIDDSYYIYCTYTQLSPNITLNSPLNESTGIHLTPTCSIDANEANGDTMTVYWYENTTGDWVLRQTNSSVAANSTVTWVYNQASLIDTKYWWKVSVNDSIYNTTEIFHFTTKDIIPPYDLKTKTYNTTQINLSWTKGDYSDRTVIRWDTDSYPTSLSDGNLSCNTTDENYSQTNLPSDTRIYFRAWSYNISYNKYATISCNNSGVTWAIPNASSLNITPSIAYTTNDITCNYTYSNGYQGNTSYVWKVNGIEVSNGTTTKSIDYNDHFINDSISLANDVYSVDIDYDGDIDIISSYSGNIAWFENNGTDSEWLHHPIDTVGITNSVYAADMDGDGDLDVLAADLGNDDIIWWENNGTGGGWTEHVIDGAHDASNNVFVTDMNRDGYLDVLAPSFNQADITWWRNTDGSGTNWIEYIVDDSYSGATDEVGFDMDDDGDIDIISTASSSGDISWWENKDNYGTNWTEHLVNDSFSLARKVEVEDIDDDDDIDIVVIGLTDGLAWFENSDGNGTNWIEHVIDDNIDGNYIYLEDLDGDGDIDIFVGDSGENFLVWLENSDGLGGSWINNTLSLSFDSAGLYSYDLVGNGVLEFIAADSAGGNLVYFDLIENGTTSLDCSNFGAGDTVRCEITPINLAGESGPMQFVEITISNHQPSIDLKYPIENGSTNILFQPVCEIWANDIDGDSLTVCWYENTTGEGPQWNLRQTNESVVANSTIQWIFTKASDYNTTYWFKVIVNDSNNNYSEWFVFTTEHNTNISVSPNNWNQGSVLIGSSNETTGFYFNLSNLGDAPLNIQIRALNATNSTTGASWTLNSTQGHDNFTMQYNLSDSGNWTNINPSYDTFITGLDTSSWQTFDLKLIMATTSSTTDRLSLDIYFRSVIS